MRRRKRWSPVTGHRFTCCRDHGPSPPLPSCQSSSLSSPGLLRTPDGWRGIRHRIRTQFWPKSAFFFFQTKYRLSVENAQVGVRTNCGHSQGAIYVIRTNVGLGSPSRYTHVSILVTRQTDKNSALVLLYMPPFRTNFRKNPVILHRTPPITGDPVYRRHPMRQEV